MEVSAQLRAPAALPVGNSHWYPLDRRLGGPQSQSGRDGEEKNIVPATNQTSAIQPIAILTELSQLSETLSTNFTLVWMIARDFTAHRCHGSLKFYIDTFCAHNIHLYTHVEKFQCLILWSC
jgi:hypothetical protein